MRTNVHISIKVEGGTGGAGPELFEKLTHRMPSCFKRTKRKIYHRAEESDPVIQQAFAILDEMGVEVEPAYKPNKKIHTSYRKKFDAEDIENAELLLVLSAMPSLCKLAISMPEGASQWEALKCPATARNRAKEFGGDYMGYYLMARGQMLDVFAESGLKGLCFESIGIEGGKWPKETEPPQMLWSNVMLPSALNRFFIMGKRNEGKSFSAEEIANISSIPYSRIDGDRQQYVGLSPRYRRSEIDALGEFDVAVSREYHFHRRELIVSQKFRKFCEALKLKIDYTPVYLEDC